MSRLIDLTGQVFGELTVLRRAEDMNGTTAWLCQCSCGTIRATTAQRLKSGATKSCGCLKNKLMANTKTKHGCSKNPTKEYKAWLSMKGRCLNPDYKNFKNYGGRGITVDPLWVSSFTKFLEDMGPAPTKQHSLDRIDNEKGYTPENCRWATKKEQSRNTRTNRKLLFDGQEMPVAQLAEELGVPAHRIYAAIYKGKR